MNAGESTEEISSEDALTRLRTAVAKFHFAMQGMWERSKRLWASMHGDPNRGPEDYEEEIAARVERIISQKYGRWHVEYRNGDGDGKREDDSEKLLLKWILGVSSLLLVGGIGGGIAMYGKLSSIEKGQEGHEQRINRLEQERDRRAQPGAP